MLMGLKAYAEGLRALYIYTAAWLDRATGLYDMRARTYDPQTGRFLSRDPNVPDAMVPEETNLYAYALNDSTAG